LAFTFVYGGKYVFVFVGHIFFALVLVFAGAMGLLALARGVHRRDAAKRREREDRILRRGSRLLARVLGLRVHVEGSPPRGRFLLVSNHLSYLDVPALMSVLDARFLSKSEVASWPLLGPVTRFVGTIFVDRTRRTDLPRVIDEIESTLDEGRGVVFFPEGTSSPGARVLPFKASLFQVAAVGRFPVSCAAIRYRSFPGDRPAAYSLCWWGGMEFGGHFLSVLGMRGFEVFMTFSETRVRDEDRKRLAAAAQERVESVFTPTCDASELDVDGLSGAAEEA